MVENVKVVECHWPSHDANIIQSRCTCDYWRWQL